MTAPVSRGLDSHDKQLLTVLVVVAAVMAIGGLLLAAGWVDGGLFGTGGAWPSHGAAVHVVEHLLAHPSSPAQAYGRSGNPRLPSSPFPFWTIFAVLVVTMSIPAWLCYNSLSSRRGHAHHAPAADGFASGVQLRRRASVRSATAMADHTRPQLIAPKEDK